MCARLLACPLCSQPGFLTLDALRAGLISVATRPLICPVCNEVLLGIDKLTIHLFSHTINLSNNTAESKYIADNEQVAVHNAHNVALQDWNILKTQQSCKMQTNDNNNTKQSDAGIANTENNFSIINSQLQARNQNNSVKNANQYSFMSDYNYDAIKVNIFPQSNENPNVVLRPTANLQQDVLKTDCTTQYFCDDNIKHLNIITETTQAEKTISDLITGTKMTESADTNIYRDIERECESNNNQCVAKERLMISLIEKENNLANFQSIQNIIPACANASSEKCNDKENSSNTRETVLETNAEYQDQNSEHRKLLSHTCTKVFQTITLKEKMERCNICGFHFPDTNILALHKQLVHEQNSSNISGKVLKNYSCHLCSKVFKMRGSLMVHMRVAHFGHNLGSFPKDGQIEFTCSDTGYTCPTCGKRFKKEQHVIQHMKTHESKQWECDTCSKLFTTKYFLKKHKRLHSGEMPYKCKICDKSFTFQQSYHKHRFYHKDEKPHSCATCGRSFKELSTLHNHERIHTGEKPFACETCGKCFRQRVSYLVHRRIHTGVMPYKCTMCGKSFRYKVSQRTHKCPAQILNNTQQFDKIAQDADDKAIRPQTNTLQENQLTTNVVDNEENKFVLIINAQGQHVLALQSEINNVSFERKEENMEFIDSNNINKNSKSTNNFNSVQLEESAESLKKIQSDNEKIDIKSTNDFFSMVMSPLENSIPSPTFEMEHLRVSSPKRKENSIDSYTNFSQVSDNVQMNAVDSGRGQSFNRNKVTDTLQTINEESLKELLYGMDRK
ncbi:zinc finger protein 846-like [Cataglyphis hispanica]|uniref:zinc finger protein 846-like n=1 Tax=Cataglyphis hispanica TaxID=1086592 RepID=UPI0021801389|nr:zinc finger protein 846-like [Cataglyphis hispanica]